MSDLLTVTDQMGQRITFSYPPKRIISLVPSQTEFLLDIGAPVVGRTKFCIHPKQKVEAIPIVGGTKNFRFEKIQQLKPDLIVGNKEENYLEGIYELARDFPVWMSDIATLEDAYQMMSSLGSISDLELEASKIVSSCQRALTSVRNSKKGKVIYLIWKNPWMTAGSGTFIDGMLAHLGYENLIKEPRYPSLLEEEIRALDPDKVLFSSEPFPFKDEHLVEAKKLWPKAARELVDGELLSWYGSRMQHWA